MAGKSTVGSLYYQVLMDASGWTRGMTKIRSEQAMLKKSIQNLDKSMGTGTDRYKSEMLERVALLRKLLQQGKITSARFKELYKAEARSYKMYEDEKIKKAKAAADERTRIAEREAKRRAKLYKERHAAVRDGQFGFKRMVGAHMGDISMGFRKGGFQGLNQVATSMQNMFMKFWPFLVGWQVLKGVVTSIGRTVGKIISLADERARQTTIMSNLFGNKKEAKMVQQQLIDYAKRTSFGVKQTMELSNQLVALGFNAREAVDGIKLFGNLSFGDPFKLRLIAKAFSDVKAQGKLMMTEVRQFANQGVPLLDQLAFDLNTNAIGVRKMITEGSVSAEMVEKALREISGRYGDTAGAAMETSVGQWEKIKETVGEIATKVGGPLSSALRIGILEPLADLLDRYEDLVPSSEKGSLNDKLGEGVGYGIQSMYNPIGVWMKWADTAMSGFTRTDTGVGLDLKLESQNLVNHLTLGFMGLSDEATEASYSILAMAKAAKEAKDAEDAELERLRKEREEMEKRYPWLADQTFDEERKKLQDEQLKLTMGEVEFAKYKYEEQVNQWVQQKKISAMQGAALIAEYDRLEAQKKVTEVAKKVTQAALPTEAFKKNSVAEFEYLRSRGSLVQAQKDNSEKVASNTVAVQQNTEAFQAIASVDYGDDKFRVITVQGVN